MFQIDFASAIQKLEFDKIIERVRQFSVSEPAKDRAHTIQPSIHRTEIELELRRVTEAKEVLIAEGAAPLDGIKNINPSLKRTAVENQILTPRELLDVGSTLRASRLLTQFLAKRRRIAPQLADVAGSLFQDRILELHISEALDEEGTVKDTASNELRRIRSEMSTASEHLRRRLASILKRISAQEFLQDEIITTRDGRMVIPVKVEHKNHVPGFIHSTSASGATVFIEPAETLELNNALRELQFQEQREMDRILALLTAQVRDVRDDLSACLNLLTILDLTFAKAKYSIEIVGNCPSIADEPTVRLVQARHPVLLQRHRREEVVPLDLELGREATTLVITGPNAGGKSVALKTIGLLTLCAQSGMHIPAGPDSQLGLFQKIFVDMGDDQSIENDLSTFSSHLVRLKHIIDHATSTSLVLIDEIGAGTDPAEGGALATAILSRLTRQRVLTIATTHHGHLKAFAHETAGIMNGSMEFNQSTLRPTYQFRYGIPGSSYALELAVRLGLSSEVVAEARGHLGEEKTSLERLLLELEQQVQAYRLQVREASTERDRLQSLVRLYEEKMGALKSELKEIRKTAAQEAQAMLKNAQTLIERSIKEIRESQADRQTVKDSREQLRQFSTDVQRFSPAERREAEPFGLGDRVRLREGTEVGEIIELKKESATVLWRNGRLRVQLADLIKERQEHSFDSSSSHSYYSPEAKTQIDLRGLMGDEAIATAQSFLDNAYVAGLHRVDIIHGKGTGALRKRIAEFLKSHPHIKSFRLGEWNEGGSGVTVVELNDN